MVDSLSKLRVVEEIAGRIVLEEKHRTGVVILPSESNCRVPQNLLKYISISLVPRSIIRVVSMGQHIIHGSL